MRVVLLFVLLLSVAACSRHEPEEFQIEGLQKPSVLDKLGNPKGQYEIDGKRLKDSMGPKPSFAQLMADDDTVEVWSYSLTDNRAAAVYFDESGAVSEVVFFRTDVMY